MGSSPTEAPYVKALREAGITMFTGVPDSAFNDLIEELEATEVDGRYVLADREDNACALACGAWLAGDQPLVFLESSGLGNAVDVLTSLAIVYEIPIVLLISWAGYEGRDVPHHNVIGEPLARLLDALEVPSVEVRLDAGAQRVGMAVEHALALGLAQRRPAAVLGIPGDLADAP